MGCANGKEKKASSSKLRKPYGEDVDEKFWDDPNIKDN